MGVYDTINGEQVKCFPWVSLYEGKLVYHGGTMDYYDTGSVVPYRKPHYNYGPNFVILDVSLDPHSDYSGYDYVLHVIRDGKVKDTFVDKIGAIDWSVNETVVDYSGHMLQIQSDQDIMDFIEVQRKFWNDREVIRSHWNALFRELSKVMHGIGLLDPNSEEKKERHAKFEEIHALMDAEEARIKDDMDALNDEFLKWFVDTSEIHDLIHLGAYIDAYLEGPKGMDKEMCLEQIHELLAADPSLYDRYVSWQGTDEYIKDYRPVPDPGDGITR